MEIKTQTVLACSLLKGGGEMQIVYYFEKPTIGYCPECDCLAVYRRNKLICPNDKVHELSFFVWDESSEPPE